MSDQTTLAYLPVELDSKEDNDKMESEFCQNMKKFSFVEGHQALYHRVELRLDPLPAVALKDISCPTNDCRRYSCHFLLTSQKADLPEAGDMVSLKRGSFKFFLYHTCFVTRNKMRECTMDSFRTLECTLSPFDVLHDGDNTIAEQVEELSMLSLLPVLSKFVITGITPSVDIYALFRYEPMHAFIFHHASNVFGHWSYDENVYCQYAK